MRSVGYLMLGALLVGGCGSVSGADGAPVGSVGVADGSYEVGKDIKPGVYVAALDCLGTIAAKRGYSSLDSNPDAFLGGSVRVGEQQRVALKAGQFFTSEECREGWQLETGDGSVSPDPATLRGACAILRGDDDVAQQAVDALEDSPNLDSASADGYVVQERLMAIVYSRTAKIWQHAGDLVDYLDAPQYFVGVDGNVADRVRTTVQKIDALCSS